MVRARGARLAALRFDVAERGAVERHLEVRPVDRRMEVAAREARGRGEDGLRVCSSDAGGLARRRLGDRLRVATGDERRILSLPDRLEEVRERARGGGEVVRAALER